MPIHFKPIWCRKNVQLDWSYRLRVALWNSSDRRHRETVTLCAGHHLGSTARDVGTVVARRSRAGGLSPPGCRVRRTEINLCILYACWFMMETRRPYCRQTEQLPVASARGQQKATYTSDHLSGTRQTSTVKHKNKTYRWCRKYGLFLV